MRYNLMIMLLITILITVFAIKIYGSGDPFGLLLLLLIFYLFAFIAGGCAVSLDKKDEKNSEQKNQPQ